MTEKIINVNKKLILNFYLLFAAIVAATFISGPDYSSMPFGQWLAVNLAFALFYILPLLFFIPSIHKPNARNMSWLGFFLLAYLLWAIVWPFFTLFSHFLVTTLVLTTFLYTVKWLRPLKKEAKARKAAEEAEDSVR